MKNHKCKGMQDLLPNHMLRFRRIEDTFRSCCRNWGYQEVRTPTLEYLYLFTATGTLTPDMLSRVYSFLDWDGWSGERVVLRPDGTIPVARLYIDNLSGQESARLFYVTDIFSFEGTGRKNRERWQCGAEFFGAAKFTPDVEVILLAEDVIRKLGIRDVKLQLSHAGLVRALLKEFKLSPAEEARITDRILEGRWEALTKARPDNPEIERLMAALLDLKGKSSSFLRNVRASFPKASPDFKSSLEDFLTVTTLLDNLGCSYEIDIAAMHGFEYYTGVCFQFMAAGEKIGGGGRYDKLVPLMNGGDIPACGFALYVDPMMTLLPPDKEEKARSGISVKGKGATPEIVRRCFVVAESLRNAGHVVELHTGGQESTDLRWTLDVQNRAPLFVLSDRIKNREFEVQSVNELLALLASKEL
jgi:histidyl-tRNA synthetase